MTQLNTPIRTSRFAHAINLRYFDYLIECEKLFNGRLQFAISVIKHIVADDRKYARYKCQYETDAETLFDTTN